MKAATESQPGQSHGWFCAHRTQDALELLETYPRAFLLAYIIGYRARYRDGFNQHGLGFREAFLGDFERYGMTEQEYRTAKQQLKKWHFATFKTTNTGTIAKLTDSRLFSVLLTEDNEQANTQATDDQRTGNGQLTTNNKDKKDKTEKKGESAPVPVSNEKKQPLSAAERISYEGERVRIKENLQEVRNGASHTAWGPQYDTREIAEIKRLKDRDAELVELLGCAV